MDKEGKQVLIYTGDYERLNIVYTPNKKIWYFIEMCFEIHF